MAKRIDHKAKDRRTYRKAVEAVVGALRPRFESGELRGFTDADAERCQRDAAFEPPSFRIERACERAFIKTPEAALLVLRSAGRRRGAERFDWRASSQGPSLQGAAAVAMAADVLAAARRRRWIAAERGVVRTLQVLPAVPRAAGGFDGALWVSAIEAARSAYWAEVNRLVEALESRIRAGEFSGQDEREMNRIQRLEDELEASHPMCAALKGNREFNDTQGDALFIVGLSAWPSAYDESCKLPDGSSAGRGEVNAAACLAADVMLEASRRGWVDRYPRGFWDSREQPWRVQGAGKRRRAA